MTDKTLNELLTIVNTVPRNDVDRVMADRAQAEIERRFTEWCRGHWQRDSGFDATWAQWLRENEIGKS